MIELIRNDRGDPIDYRFLDANRVFGAQTRLPEPIGCTARDLDRDAAHHWMEECAQVAATGIATTFTRELREFGRCYEIRVLPVDGAADRHLAALSRDVTSERQAREALRESEERYRSLVQFLSFLSHELRTPLNAVIGLAELMSLRIPGPITERQEDHLARIRSSAYHQLTLIEQILAWTRSEAGREEVLVDRVDATDIAQEVCRMLELSARQKGLTLSLAGADEPIHLVTDGGKVRQILTNLTENAIKFTGDGAVEVRIDARADEVVFRVSDTGPGIPAPALDTIFQPFVQVGDARMAGPEGTGLGLTISRRLARLLGGNLTVESGPADGSTFTLRLPRDPSAEA